MKTVSAIAGMASIFLAATSAEAAPDPVLFDKNGDGRLDREEGRIYQLHALNAVLAAYDVDRNGLLEGTEVAAMNAGFQSGRVAPDQVPQVIHIADAIERDGYILLGDVVPIPKPKEDACAPAGRVFVRRDPLDVDPYSGDVSQKEAKGASLAISSDDASGYEATEIHGVVAYAFGRICRRPPPASEPGSFYVGDQSFAVSVHADGVRTDDDPEKDKSTVRIGFDAQVALVGGPIFDAQYVTASPYYMSDFRWQAKGYGAKIAWEPYQADWRLGYTAKQISPSFDAYWQVRTEADWLHVNDVGRTELKAGTDYAWIGGVLGFTAFPFPEAWDYRVKAYGTWSYHRDVNQGRDARLYGLGTAYNLTQDGAVAISLDYSWGLERDKLNEVDRTTLSLSFKH